MPLGSAARATCLSNQKGRKGTERFGKLMITKKGTENFVSLITGLLSGMDRYPLLFSEMLPRPNIFHFEIVCTWLKSKKEDPLPSALCNLLTVTSSGLALF